MTKHAVLVPRFVSLLLCATALTACASLGGADAPRAQTAAEAPAPTMASSVDENVRKAQLLRHGGQYDDAIKILSQLMLVAADDPRVVAEYGKSLAQKGRAHDATQFLSRAIELAPGDWTVYSALGVSYDQLGNHAQARAAYERALAIRPGEASVLNNYALSRMMAKDPEGAKALISRAEIAGGGTDEKIARNIAMIKAMAPEKTKAEQDVEKTLAYDVKKAAPAPAAKNTAPVAVAPKTQISAAAPRVAPRPPREAQNQVSPQQRAAVPAPQPAANAPRNLQPAQTAGQTAGQTVQQTASAASLPYSVLPSGVVMQRVPHDPLAGPVKSAARPPAHSGSRAAAAKAAQGGATPSLRMAAEGY